MASVYVQLHVLSKVICFIAFTPIHKDLAKQIKLIYKTLLIQRVRASSSWEKEIKSKIAEKQFQTSLGNEETTKTYFLLAT